MRNCGLISAVWALAPVLEQSRCGQPGLTPKRLICFVAPFQLVGQISARCGNIFCMRNCGRISAVWALAPVLEQSRCGQPGLTPKRLICFVVPLQLVVQISARCGNIFCARNCGRISAVWALAPVLEQSRCGQPGLTPKRLICFVVPLQLVVQISARRGNIFCMRNCGRISAVWALAPVLEQSRCGQPGLTPKRLICFVAPLQLVFQISARRGNIFCARNCGGYGDAGGSAFEQPG